MSVPNITSIHQVAVEIFHRVNGNFDLLALDEKSEESFFLWTPGIPVPDFTGSSCIQKVFCLLVPVKYI